jgi:DNA invertase Pin-like site-specific DNA recombinase
VAKAYSYLRFSTPDQAKGDSSRRQTDLAAAYALRHNLELDEKLTFKDLGVSAYRGANVVDGQLGAFLDAVKSGLVEQGSYLLVESLDRLSRQSARKALRTLEAICDEGVVLVTLTDNREYTRDALDNDPMSLILSLLTFIRANEESATKARRVRAAWDTKRSKVTEKPLTAKVPGWLTLDRGLGAVRVIKDRADVVKRIFRLTLKGYGQHRIAETLNREAVPPFGSATRWHRSYVLKILKNPATMGTLIPHRLEYEDGKRTRKPLGTVPGYYPPVIDPDTFHRVQAMRGARTPLRGRHATGEVRNVFGGLGRCPKCDGSMTLVNKGQGNGHPYLVCAAAKSGAGCTYRAVRYPQAEEAFLRDAGRLLATVPGGLGSEAIDEELDRTEASLEVVDEAIGRLLDAIQRGRSNALSERLRALEGDRDTLEQQRRELSTRQAQVMGPLVQRKLDDLSDALKADPLDRRKVNVLLRQLCDRIEVDYLSGLLRFHWKHGSSSDVLFGWPAEEVSAPRKAARPKAIAGSRKLASKSRRKSVGSTLQA